MADAVPCAVQDRRVTISPLRILMWSSTVLVGVRMRGKRHEHGWMAGKTSLGLSQCLTRLIDVG